MLKSMTLRSTLAAVAWALTVSAHAMADAPRQFNIPPGDLASAIEALEKQAAVDLVFQPDQLRGLRTKGVTGTYEPKDAIRILIKGAPLELRTDPSGAMVIAPAHGDVRSGKSQESSSTHDQQEEDKSLEDRFRVAQVDQGASAGRSSIEGSDRQGSDQNSAKLEEVIVTAQKREERLIDVPISIVALSGDELQSRKLTSLDDLQFAVPGMAVSSNGVANFIELRGVSNILGTAPLVGVYVDEVDVTNNAGYQPNPNTYDLERVEVLRGPQGTLYGEGSAGGTVRFITKSPVLDRFGMTASVASLFTQDGSPGERINTAINVPLITDELGLRIVAAFNREGGWIDQPAAGLKDINGQDLTNVRIKTLWQPAAKFSASVMAEVYRDDRSTGTLEDARGNFSQVFNLTTTPKVNEDHDIYNLTLTYDFPAARILSATSYLREKVEAKNTGQRYPGPQEYDYLTPYTLINDHSWIEELRLSSSGSGPWQWTVGGFYRDYRDISYLPISNYDVPDASPPASYAGFLGDTLFKSWSVFGDINYTLGERFTLGAGVRSFHENQDYILEYGSLGAEQTGNFHSVDPRVYAQYKLSRGINIYASAAKGFRSGGFNVDPAHPTFGPEDVRNYELGSKISVLEGRLSAETAIYYTDYRDYVTLFSSDMYAPSLNAGNARIKGVEWSFVWRPSDRWSLGINGNYLETRFIKIDPNSKAHAVGDPLDVVPKYQMTSFAERDFTWDDKQLSMRLDFTRRGRMSYRDRSFVPELYAESDVVNLLGYYMSLRWNKSLSFNLFAQNLLNDRGLIIPDTGSPVRSRPRLYGVGFDVAFGGP